jgi:hypothetical protein
VKTLVYLGVAVVAHQNTLVEFFEKFFLVYPSAFKRHLFLRWIDMVKSEGSDAFVVAANEALATLVSNTLLFLFTAMVLNAGFKALLAFGYNIIVV